MARPFLKWVGGKTQLLKELENGLPPCPEGGYDYVEPFLGGGALFFHLQKTGKIKSALLNDANAELILCYRVVKENVQGLIDELSKIEEDIPIEMEERKNQYFNVHRKKWNEHPCTDPLRMDLQKATKRAALTIYLNKTCFNGLFRVNRKGEFNTPFGFPKNREICDTETLNDANKALQNVTLSNTSCFDLEIFEPQKWNLIYFDPPYRPITPTSFVAYDKSGFNDDHQKRLRNFAIKCEEKGIFIMLSNSDPTNFVEKDDYFDDLFKQFDLKRILAKRMINSDGGNRGKIREILVTTKPNRSRLHKQ